MARPDISNWDKLACLAGFLGLALGAYAVFRPSPGPYEGSSAPQPVPPQPARVLDPGDHFLLLGDSIGDGVGPPLDALSNVYGTVLTRRTVQGTSILYWAGKTDDTWGAYKAIVVSLGSNDAAQLSPSAEMPALGKLVADLRSHGAQVFWLVPPSFTPGALKPKQLEVANMFAHYDVPPLDLRGPHVGVESDPARLHPTPQGYKTLASQVFDALTRLE